MDNKENKHQNDNNQPKMPKFNMNWIYTVILIALCILFITGLSLIHISEPTRH